MPPSTRLGKKVVKLVTKVVEGAERFLKLSKEIKEDLEDLKEKPPEE